VATACPANTPVCDNDGGACVACYDSDATTCPTNTSCCASSGMCQGGTYCASCSADGGSCALGIASCCGGLTCCMAGTGGLSSYCAPACSATPGN
jgi:hypothetical protein